MTLDRRRFLKLSALGVIGGVADACASNDTGNAVDHPALLAMLGPERVRELGALYRAATPSENNADALRSAIAKGRGSKIPFFGNTSIDDQIEDDFAGNRTVLVDGWVLAVTEARQAALYSLTPA